MCVYEDGYEFIVTCNVITNTPCVSHSAILQSFYFNTRIRSLICKIKSGQIFVFIIIFLFLHKQQQQQQSFENKIMKVVLIVGYSPTLCVYFSFFLSLFCILLGCYIHFIFTHTSIHKCT